MGKRTTLFAQLDVVPIAHAKPDGEEGEVEEGKQLIFTDPEAGELIFYPMTEKFAKKIGTRLRMSNKALAGELEAEARRAEAHARLGVSGMGNGEVGGLSDDQQKAAKDLLEGVHIKEEEET